MQAKFNCSLGLLLTASASLWPTHHAVLSNEEVLEEITTC